MSDDALPALLRPRPRQRGAPGLGPLVRGGRDPACRPRVGRAGGVPWPILEEAAKIGLYSVDFFATQAFEETGLGIPVAMEELFWGDAGIGLSIVGSALAAAGVSSNGTPRAGG